MPTDTQSKPKKVVVVEDDSDFQVLIEMMLSAPGAAPLEVIPAATGRGGLEAVRRHRPDVVILDLRLPDMHGWEVFMRLREELGEGMPVIILSSEGTRHDRTFGTHVARVHDYLTKPCMPSRLRRSVETALGAG
jgi:DNA-binding response OmpR family regulator